MGDRLRLTDTAGLDDDIVELLHHDDLVQLLDEVHLQGAADATILQGHQTVVLLPYHATFFNQVGIDVHLAYVVDNHGEFNAFTVVQYLVDHSGLAATEVTSEQQYGNIFLHFTRYFKRGAKIRKFKIIITK